MLLPHALALGDDQKILFVADRQNQRIVAYNSTTGVYISEYAKDLNSPIFSVAYCPFHGITQLLAIRFKGIQGTNWR